MPSDIIFQSFLCKSSMPRAGGDLELADFTRGRIVDLLEGGLSQCRVAEIVGCSQQTVSNVWRRWKSTGSCAVAQRHVRPCINSSREVREIRMAIIRDRFRSYRMIRY